MELYFLILLLCFVTGNNDKQKETEDEIKRRRIIEQLTKTRTVILDDYQFVTRQIATDVFMYRSYRTVSVIFFRIMSDVSVARFTLQSEELHLNNIGSCSPQEVVINLKPGSYPAVNPDGYDFPKNFIDPDAREEMHTIELLSDGKNASYIINNPKPDIWYALVYIKWQDPSTQKVEQEGLVADCHTILYTDLQVKKEENIKIINCYNPLTIDYDHIPALYKCMATDDADPISLNITITNTHVNNSQITFQVQPLSLPSNDNFILYCVFDPRLNNIQTITYDSSPSSWHYIKVDYASGNTSSIANCESYYSRDFEEPVNQTIVDLMRDDKGRFFTYDFGLPTTDLQDATSLVNITSQEIKSLRFKVNDFIDIGGNLVIEASLLMSLKYYVGYKRERVKDTLLAFTEENQFFKTVICMDIGHPSVPLESGECKFNDKVKPALFVLNSTDSDSIYEKVLIPYPDSGTWYLTFRLFCDKVVCPCRTSDNGTKYYVPTSESVEVETSTFSNVTREGESDCNATVVLSISSTSCLNNRCSNHGTCGLNTYGGLVMSFCSCSAGYGSWDCSDASRMDSRAYMLVSVLLLTLSNLLFIFSIYVASIRYYYTEAMMYAFTMFFSSFYHACDAPAQVAYCITRGNILQFGDFYCGLMSFWVTLLAMSIISDKLRSSLQLIGAIIVALLTTWNMHSFVSFLLPVAVGVFVLFLSWYIDYKKIKCMRYPRSYYTKYLPCGVVLVTIGLICYAFLQTEQNYKIVHSLWHAIIAVSVVFLLPDAKRTDINPFVPIPGFCWTPFNNLFKRRQDQ
ncbi:post-GPI attachment to proteins factor 6 [Colias croceus]|uniref:post-GPI attachment to proteins factor 6 n=1 Tax=Colias crocea TaxID=72248 RepID=UPI001E280A22|nr:post-GPI attachment to proteins factor 6 [Colias croceus]